MRITALEQAKGNKTCEKGWLHDLEQDQRSGFDHEFDTDLDIDDQDIDFEP